ncbi:p-loop containing nucleoside triphosphate hydrolases superfamily protein isoform 1 [Quillaja saponaria]|uniref:P-loop containing nucleoside triphosphate hydrolases superfamily protein isoform 1 n=1 Tax=Quillaja saponaria TaxID=32244 RepID=A0AAD7KUY5_QUISA|nr:p-loop containing nucleoside triphosphate hydrolases superfamily protein isoform 1 [Quillaja saponaria]
MAVLEKLTRTARTLLTTHTSKTLTSLPGRPCVIHRRLLHGRKQEGSSVFNAFKVQSSRLQTEARKPIAWISAFLAGIGLVGVNVPKVGHTDADKGDAKPSLPSESPSRPVDLEGIAKKQQQQIDDLLRSKGMKSGSHPVVGVSVINGKVRTCFYIPPACEASHLIANLVSHLGLKVEGSSSVLEMPLFSWDSAAGWNLGLKHPGRRKDIQADQ